MKKVLLFFTMLFMLIFYGQAQTVTIGTGITGKYTMPVNTYYNYSYVQEIFLASEMEDLTDSIYSIAFQYIHSSSQTKNPVTIYLGNTTKTNFSTSSDWVPVSAMNQVFQGSVTFTANSWVTITFTTPFEWDGTSNIVVAILNNNGAFTTSNNSTFNVHSTPNNRTLYHSVDGTTPLNATSPPSSGYLSTDRNNVRFEYGPASSCKRPKNFATANIGVTEATVSWTTGDVETQWEYVYGPQGTVNLQTAVPITVTDTFAFLSSLNPNTIYDVYVRAICGTESSRWLGGAFRTLCGTIMALPYTENFDAYGTGFTYFPNCWTHLTNNTSTNYPYLSTINHSAPASLYFYGTTTLYSIAALPQIPDQYNISELQLNFYSQPSSANYSIQVGVMTDPYDNATFEVIQSITSSETTWKYNEIFFNSYEGDARFIAFRTYGTTSYYYIDNIELEAPACSYPVNIRASNIAGSSAMINWDFQGVGVPLSYKVEYCETGTEQWSAPLNTIHRNMLLTGLTENTTYDVRVATNCEETTSAYRNITFTTDCYAVQNIGSVETGTGTAYTIPVNNYYRYTYSQQIYSATELGGTARNISTISFKYAYSNPMTKKNRVKIYLQHTTDAVFTSDFKSTTGAVLVYDGPLNCVTGWNKFTLDTPFHYNETDHLLMTVLDNSGNYDGTSYTFVTHSAANKAIHAYRDETTPYEFGNVTGGTVLSQRNNIRFGTCDPNPTCVAPNLFVGTVSPTQIHIFWAAGSTETSWEIEYKLATNTNWTSAGTVSTTTFDINGLNFGSLYHIRVRSVCGTDYSTWSTISDRTLCAAVTTLPYEENFDTYGTDITSYPYCWKRITTNGSTYPYIGSTHSTAPGSLYFYTTSDLNNYNMAILPEVSTDIEIADLEVVFKMQASSTNSFMIVGVMNNPSDASTFVGLDTLKVSTTNVWENKVAKFENYTGTGKYIALKGYAPGSLYYVDDLSIDLARTCDRPENVRVKNISQTTAQVIWSRSAVAQSWEIVYGEKGFNPTSATPIVATDTIYTLSNLSAETAYDVYVREYCGETEPSNWSFVTSFTTLCNALEELPYTENFDTYGTATTSFPDCWTRKTNNISTNYPYLSTTNHSAPASLYFYGTTALYSIAALPQIPDQYNINELQLNFYARPSSANYSIQVGVMTDPYDNATFEVIQNITSSETTWKYYEIFFDRYEGDARFIAFRMYGGFTGYYYIDDVELIEAPACSYLVNIRASNIVGSSAMINWDFQGVGVPLSYKVEYCETGTEQWSAPLNTIHRNMLLTGLTENTTYDVRVATNCEETTSAYRNITFTTDCYTVQNIGSFESGTGTASAIPVNNLYKYTYSQQIYTATELGGTARNISTISFKYAYISPMTKKNRVKIYLQHTTDAVFTSDFKSTAGAVLVYDGPLNCVNGWNKFTLNTPFPYNGTNHLLMTVLDNSGNYDGASYTFVTHSAANKAIHAYRDGTTPYEFGNITGGTIISQRNDIRFTNCDPNPPTCVAPNLFVGTINPTQIHIFWAAGSTETSWEVEYKLSTQTNWTSAGTVSTTTFDISGLNFSSLYDIRVRSVCDTHYSTWVTVSARTPCITIATLPYEENFDTYGTSAGAFPNCWIKPITYFNFPSIVYNYSVSSPASLKFQSQIQTPTYAVTPVFDMELNRLQLTFSLKAESIIYSGTITVGVMSNPNDSATFEPVQVITPTNTSWTEYQIYLNGVAMTGLGNRIAFKHNSNASYSSLWLDDVFVYEIPSCIKVTNVRSNTITSTGATVLWHPAPSTDNNWEYVCGVSGFAPDLATPVAVTDTIAVLTNLQPNTTYNIYVRTVCSDGTSRWSNVHSFTTICSNYGLPFFEDFATATFPPTCWNRYSGLASQVFAGTPLSNSTSVWTRSTNNYGLATPHAKINIYGTDRKDWVVTPSIDLTGAVNPMLTFRLALTGYDNNNVISNLTGQSDDQFMVIVSTDGGATWNANNATVWNNKPTGDYSFNNIFTHGQTVAINLAQYAGQNIKIAFYAESTVSNGNNDLHIDSVRVQGIQGCNVPTNLTVNGITASSATLAWTAGGGETSWMVEYKKSTATNYVSTTVTSPTYTFTGLDPATLYQIRVKAICDATSESVYLTGQFTTETPVVTYTIMATAGNGGTIDPSGNIIVGGGTNKTFTITPNQGYEIRMVTVDQTTELGNISSYTFNNIVANHFIDAQFQAICNAPTNLTVNGITASSATLAWTAGGGETSWMVEYKKSTATNYVSTTVTSPTYTLADLDPATLYQVRVRAICDATSESTYITSQFTTETPVVTYTIMATAGNGGTIDPSGDIIVGGGTNKTFTITPNQGYEIRMVTVDQTTELGNISSYTFNNIVANHFIDAQFQTICNAPTNLTVNGITVSSATLAWTAGGGETSWMVEYKKSTATNYVSTTVTSPTYTLADLDPTTLYQVRVKAICDATSESTYITSQFTTETPVVTYTITATAGNGGTIDPSGNIIVGEGTYKTFTITPNQGYEVRMVTVDQTTELGNLSSYTFNNIVANHFIDAQFQTTGIENQDLLNEVTLAPNPTEQFVKLTIQNNRITVKEAGIYDAYGKLIQVINITGSETTINLNHFSNGVYFIRLISDEGLITKKLIKK